MIATVAFSCFGMTAFPGAVTRASTGALTKFSVPGRSASGGV